MRRRRCHAPPLLLHRPPWLDKLIGRVPPRLRILPLPAVLLISLLGLANLVIWAAVLALVRLLPPRRSRAGLISPALLSYTLGLRHALDADHIAAIDLMTRRLVAAGARPVTVGTWFSLGHATVVVGTCVAVAATSGALEGRFERFRSVGGVIGTGVSAAVLILLGVGNGWILVRLVQRLRAVLKEEVDGDRAAAAEEEGAAAAAAAVGGPDLDGGGVLIRLFKRVLRFVDRPWKMYPLGVLFGLGFDTSSEIAVLGIASLHGAQGTSIWLILIFPVLFTAGMCLVDTTDGALMMTLYTSTSLARDTVAILYYSIVLSAITVLVAITIGTIQLLSLIANFSSGSFWDGVEAVGDYYDIIGGAICGAFAVFGAASVLLYKPWRRRVGRQPSSGAVESVELQDVDGKGDEKALAKVSSRELE
ncbi:uncharacterized protein L3040_006701 [Drepanopeziza brunnea f. sp. 'multigermtubi']|uniref:Nickel/cobalt efflux system n=1 Tax=Marssonina brunnea f. sp. multigermtubi (strain MB_m1) TaxID=1072389 RepID=K1WWX3_MARBU|nr:Ni2+-Co2+ transporter transition metal uptake transporter [Drepanopeziza brunnea f. sp. 'multigermtubi' MB_m1]EKD17581.1 Ni2+-Co2+ transporter transition metal uptake transporter [Drepanopeziza brunnea f. sp. 'multigermtubi' MB_m1]KAJ5039029.1 hypothetical protein L3040_006701 [Drepanopeziza brunnea f. sp. 'multigermtubi']